MGMYHFQNFVFYSRFSKEVSSLMERIAFVNTYSYMNSLFHRVWYRSKTISLILLGFYFEKQIEIYFERFLIKIAFIYRCRSVLFLLEAVQRKSGLFRNRKVFH